MPQQPDFTAYEASVAEVRAQMVAYSTAVWAKGDFSDVGMSRLVQFMVPKVRAGQMRVANLTSAYFGRATDTRPVPVSESVTQGRGVDPARVYERPVVTTRTEVSKGKTVPDAIAAGGRRLESLVTTDLQMAKVRQADVSLAAAGRTYYRRVPKGSHTCAKCLIASTRRYSVGHLAPIHPGCDCGVDVIPAGMDLDEVISPGLLEATHEKVKEFTGISDRSGTAVDYRHLLIEHHHGELGNVLGWRDEHFTGPSEIPAVQLDA